MEYDYSKVPDVYLIASWSYKFSGSANGQIDLSIKECLIYTKSDPYPLGEGFMGQEKQSFENFFNKGPLFRMPKKTAEKVKKHLEKYRNIKE